MNSIGKMIRWVIGRTAFVYFVIAVLMLVLVDRKVAVQRLQITQLNDTRPDFTALVNARDNLRVLSPEEFKAYADYYALVVKYIPADPTGHLMAAVLAWNQEAPSKVIDHLTLSVSQSPLLFWNVYDLAISFFRKGDLGNAQVWLGRALTLPPSLIVQAMSGSVAYRQIMRDNVPLPTVVLGIQEGKARAKVFLAACAYGLKNFERAQALSISALNDPGVMDKEPFLFYAGASALSRGEKEMALAFLVRAIEMKSHNPLVYVMAGDILSTLGKKADGERLSVMGRTMSSGSSGFSLSRASSAQISLILFGKQIPLSRAGFSI